MTASRIWLASLACVLITSCCAVAGDKKAAQEPLAKIKVHLRLNAILTSKLLDNFGTLAQREIDLQDSVRACIKSGDERLPQYQQSLKETQDDLERTKTRLVELEMERQQLTERLGKNESAAFARERDTSILESILQRLINIEKQLEKFERRR